MPVKTVESSSLETRGTAHSLAEQLEHIPRRARIQELPQGGETPGPKGLQIRPGSLVASGMGCPRIELVKIKGKSDRRIDLLHLRGGKGAQFSDDDGLFDDCDPLCLNDRGAPR